MTNDRDDPTRSVQALAAPAVARAAGFVLRLSLAGILLWIGAFKFTEAEARGIEPLIEHSPLLGWLYALGSVRDVGRWIGAAEIAIALAVLARPWLPAVAAIGSFAAAGTFLTTLSFLFTTPGTVEIVEGFFAPTGLGAFLIKDTALLGASLWCAAEALEGARARRAPADAVGRAL